MAGKGNRDLKIGFITDLDRFNTDPAAKGLEDLATAADKAGGALDDVKGADPGLHAVTRQAQDAGRALDDLDGTRAADDLDTVGRSARDTGDDLGKLQTESKETARKVDDAFDAIARSSRTSSRKVDDDTDRVKESFNEVGEEARSTGREMAASFTGSADDIFGAIQELGANAGAAFGPVGDGLALALGAGLGIFFADWQKKREKLEEDVQTFTQALVEGSGRLTEEFLNQQIAAIDPDKLKDLAKAAQDAAVPVRDVIRAYAGDPEAIARVTGKLDEAGKALAAQGDSADAAGIQNAEYNAAVSKVRDELGITTEALGKSQTAYELMKDAMAEPAVPHVDGSKAIDEADNTRARVESALRRKVKIPVGIDGASISREVQLAWLEADRYARNHPIVLRTTGPTGRRPIRDVP